MRRFLPSFLGFLYLVVAPAPLAFAQATVVEVISLKYRTEEQVIPVIQPMVGPEGSVSGFQGQLILRTTPANLEEIRRILVSIDTAPRRLSITVRQGAQLERSRREAEVSGFAGNDRARAFVPGSGEVSGGNVVIRPGDDRLRARVLDSAGSGADSSMQTIQVLEGNSAFIRVGESRPVPSRQVRRTVVGGQVVEQVVDSVEYREASTGVYVRPRVTGDRVILEVSPHRDSFAGQSPGAVNVQRMVTTVSGRLGEWIELGGIDQGSSSQGSTLLGSTSRSAADRRQVQIKVEELR
jgi:type II secretory pathway component GspD/PulD (secretin)